MMKKLLVFLFIGSLVFLNAATITGNQNQVSVTGGSISVTSSGSTVTLNSGDITFLDEGKAPTTPRKTKAKDLDEIKNSMKSNSSDEKVMNIKYPTTLSSNLLRHLRTELIKKGIPRENITLKRTNRGSLLRLNEIEIEKIKKLYPPYYKLVAKYYKKKKSTKKIPTITLKQAHVKKYHKALFIKYQH